MVRIRGRQPRALVSHSQTLQISQEPSDRGQAQGWGSL